MPEGLRPSANGNCHLRETVRSDMTKWMWRTFGQEFGPVDLAELRNLIASGTLGQDDDVQRAGSSRWQTVATVPELRTSSPSPPAGKPADSVKSKTSPTAEARPASDRSTS
jgi:hypothetical protein